ncbi:MAG: four helix bundle protein [Patescibacteria group bacterium]
MVSRLYGFYKALHDALLKFPKVERYSLGQTAQNATLGLIELLISASKTSQPQRKSDCLTLANTKLEMIKLFLRLSKDVNALTDRRYLELQSILQEVGKMLGGWIRSVKR